MSGAAARAADGGSLVHQAVQAVRDHIKDNDLKVGDTLPGEGYFAEAMGVSRAVMREAFGALAALKLIDVANGRRARVGALDGSVMAASLDHGVATSQISITDIWDVRRTLELRIAVLAATERTDEEAARIVALADAMVAAGDDSEQVTRHDIALHEAIAGASHNALFLQIVRSFGPMMTMAVPAAWRTRDTPELRLKMLVHHRIIAQAIADRDPAAARAAMDTHFDASIDDLLESIDQSAV